MRDCQLKAIRELENIFYSETRIPNRGALRTPPAPLMNKSSKLPRVEYQKAQPPRVDPYGEAKYRKHKLISPIQTNQPSPARREKYTKIFKELVKQRRRGHYTGKKYEIPQSTHR